MSSSSDLKLKAELVNALEKKAAQEAREDFYTFVRLLAHLLLPDPFTDGRHIKLICDELMLLEKGVNKQLMIFLPPGAMKSCLLKLFVSWTFGRNPTWPIIGLSHTEDLAQKHSREIRDFMKSPEYLRVFPQNGISDEVAAVGLWTTVRGGTYKAAGAATGIAGFRFRLGIIDDPLNEKTAQQPDIVKKINANYGRGFRSRGLVDRRIVIVHTRWLVNDLAGYVLRTAKAKSDQFRVIKIPALLDENGSQLLGLPEGTSFWPEMYPDEFFKDMRDNPDVLPFSDWVSLYQQEPVALDGVIFKKDHFKEWEEDEPPKLEQVILSADTAYGFRQSNDPSVIQAWGIFKRKVDTEDEKAKELYHAILLANRKGSWPYPKLKSEMKKMDEDFKPEVIIIEKKASGGSLYQDLLASGFPVTAFNPDRDKVTRAHSVTPLLEAGRVWFPKKRYAEALQAEAMSFPKGEHDDQVDAFTQALLYLKKLTNLGNDEGEEEDDESSHYRRKQRWFKRKLTKIAA